MRTRSAFEILATPMFLFALCGCAGGWKNGPPPGAEPAAATGMGARETGAGRGAPAPGSVTFVWRGEGSSVALAGEFNDWSTSADPMVRQADGSWSLSKALPPGRYQYKFVIDGNTWKQDPAARESADDGYGGKNSVVVVGARETGGEAGTPTAAAAPTARGRPPALTADGVVFVFSGAAKTVHLAGAFNGWSTTADPMARQADGTWTLTKKLPAGRHAYKFLIDGAVWKQDEANPLAEDDGFGGKNSVVVVE